MSAPLTFEISYTGATQYTMWLLDNSSWQVEGIVLNFEKANKEVSARINRNLPPSEEQLLSIYMVERTCDIVVSEEHAERINVPVELAKTLTLSARLWRHHQAPGKNTVKQYKDFPFLIASEILLKAGNSYKIEVTNLENSFRGNIVAQHMKNPLRQYS